MDGILEALLDAGTCLLVAGTGALVRACFFPKRRDDWQSFFKALKVPADFGPPDQTACETCVTYPLPTGDVQYRIVKEIGKGTYGRVHLLQADPPSRNASDPPPAFAVKFAHVQEGRSSFREVSALRRLAGCAEPGVLAARLLLLRDLPGARAGGPNQLAVVGMEPCDGSLLDLRSKPKGTFGLSLAAAAAVTRAAFEDCLSFWAAAQLLHVDIKAGNFLYSCTSAATSSGVYHVFAADFGSLVEEGRACLSTYYSPVCRTTQPLAHWSHVAFQLGCMCVWLLKAPGSASQRRDFGALQDELLYWFNHKNRTFDTNPGDAAACWIELQALLLRSVPDAVAFVQLLNGLMSFEGSQFLQTRSHEASTSSAVRCSCLQQDADVSALFCAFDRATAVPPQQWRAGESPPPTPAEASHSRSHSRSRSRSRGRSRRRSRQ